jgi:crotonobetainyl-CoA:carnitine CoA-transferase CaiB-like acyl-CoA transferase
VTGRTEHSKTNASPDALAGVRVVEMAGDAGYCGKLFADLGADVILVETRATDTAAEARRDPTFAYLNANKRSVALDAVDNGDRAALMALLASADVLLVGATPREIRRLDLDYDALKELNPRLVVTSITPFGMDGPYADFEANGLVLMALGGLLQMGGYADREPVLAYGDQATLAGNLFGAVAAMAALLDAEQTGQGQHVDVSVQESVTMALENAAQFFDLEGVVRGRPGSEQRIAGCGTFACADGWVYLLARGLGPSRFWSSVMQWLREEGVERADELEDPRWEEPDYLRSDEGKQRFLEIFSALAERKTRAELYREALDRRIPLCPVNGPADLLEDAQLATRDYFAKIEDAGTGESLRVPGAPYKLSATPWRVDRPVPQPGQHSEEVLGALASNGAAASNGRAPSSERQDVNPAGPLADVRVLDFCWVGAGSYTTKILADLGADVIKVESTTRVDTLRTSPPFKDGVPGINRSGYFADRNAGKRSITLNMKHEDGQAIARELLAVSDIVTNNFSPGTMDRLGLGYARAREIKPDVIYVSMSMQGADGPSSTGIGYGLTIAAFSGLHLLSGYPDRPPVGTSTHYPDHVPNPCHAVFATLAALRHRRRTGEGQAIEIAQTEPTIAMVGGAFVEYERTNVEPARRGNASPLAAPQGVYPCADGRWLAIAVGSDAQWDALVRVLDEPELIARHDWRAASVRLEHAAEIDEIVAGCTRGRSDIDLMHQLQAAGVPAGAVLDAADLVDRDPQLAHRGHWVRLPHPEMGQTLYNSPPFRMSRSNATLRGPAPLIGEHTRSVLRDVLGRTTDDINVLAERCALQ